MIENEYNFTEDVVQYFKFASSYANRNEMKKIIAEYIDIEYKVDDIDANLMTESLTKLVIASA